MYSNLYLLKVIPMIKQWTKVQRDRWNGTATWTVEETYDHEVTKIIDWNEVTRKWESWNQALYIKQDDGSSVLKLEQEVERMDE